MENQASCETLLDSAGNAEEGNKLCPITTDCDAVDSFASWHRICFAQNQFEWKFYTLDDLKYWAAIQSELTKRLSITSRQIGKKAESFFLQTYMDSGLNAERKWHVSTLHCSLFVLYQCEENSVCAPLEINPLCVSVKYFTMWPHL